MAFNQINTITQGVWVAEKISEYKDPVEDITSSTPSTVADIDRIYKDGHIESVEFYEY